MDPETIEGVDAREIDAASTGRLLWLRFPPVIEAAYERETGPGRSRELFWRGIVAIGIYFLLLIPDWFVTPDIFGTAVLVRFGVVARPCSSCRSSSGAIRRPGCGRAWWSCPCCWWLPARSFLCC